MVKNVADSDDPPSKSEQVMIVRSSVIADRVRNKKGTSAKAIKATPKRKLILPTPHSKTIRQKGSQGKVIQSAIETPDDDDIHG